MNNCAVRTVLSTVLGAGMGVMFGIFMGTMDTVRLFWGGGGGGWVGGWGWGACGWSIVMEQQLTPRAAAHVIHGIAFAMRCGRCSWLTEERRPPCNADAHPPVWQPAGAGRGHGRGG